MAHAPTDTYIAGTPWYHSNMSTDTAGSAFVAHLVSYPSVTQAISLMKSFPLVHRASDISKPYISAINTKVKPYSDVVLEKAQPTLSRADQLGDKLLSNIDTRFPAIKTVQPSDVISEAKFKVGSAKQKVENSASAAANSVKSKYSQVYDTNGKPYVEGIEGRIAALNRKVETYIDVYLAAATEKAKEKAPKVKEEARSELAHSYELVWEAAGRVKPTVVSIKDATVAHVQDVFTHQFNGAEAKSANAIYQVSAAVNTGFILGKETVYILYQYLSGASKAAADAVSSTSAPTELLIEDEPKSTVLAIEDEPTELAIEDEKTASTTGSEPAYEHTNSKEHKDHTKGHSHRHNGSGHGSSHNGHHKNKAHGHS